MKPLYTISTSTTIELYVGEQYYDIAQTSGYNEDMSQLYWMQIQSYRKVLNNSESVQISMCPSRKIYLTMVLHSLRLLVSAWGAGEVMVLINEIQRAFPFCERKDVTFLTGSQPCEFQVSFGRALETIATTKFATSASLDKEFIEAMR